MRIKLLLKIGFLIFSIILIIFIWLYGQNTYDRIIANLDKDYITNIKPHTGLKGEINFPIQSSYNLAKVIIVSHYTLDNLFINNVVNNHISYAEKHGYDYWFRNGIIDLSLFNLQRKKHPLTLCWQKMAAIKQAMEIKRSDNNYKYEWIMWIDGDAIFTNFSQSIKNLLQKSKINSKDYLLIARDMSCDHTNSCLENACINSGVWLVRNNNAGRLFIQTIIQSFPYYKDLILAEQAAIGDYIFGLLKLEHNKIKLTSYHGKNKCNLPVITGVKVVLGNYMNSSYNHKSNIKIYSTWQNGDYILHFAGTGKIKGEREKYINNFLDCIKFNSNNLAKCEKIDRSFK